MTRIQLAPGLEISRIINGLWQIADIERERGTLDPADTARHMAPLVEAGFTSFDMADHYGSAECIAGAFAAACPGREPIQSLTKWVPEPGQGPGGAARAAVERALERLATDRLDLLQYHAWNYADPVWLDHLFELAALQQEGLVGALGLTNFDAAHLRVACATGIPVVSNQVSYSLLDRRAAGALTSVCREYGVQLLAYGVLAGGLLSEGWVDAPEPAGPGTWSQMKYRRFIEAAGGWRRFQKLLAEVDSVARRHEVSIATVAARHVLDRDCVAGVILGARLGHGDHSRENLAIFDLALDADDRARLDAASAALEPIPGDCGDEYRRPPFLTASGDLSHHLDEIPPVFDTVSDDTGRLRVYSGTPWESFAGYCRAVRSGDLIHVSGTTATHGDRLIGGQDAAAQAHFVIDKIEAAITSLGGRLQDVVRTRVFVNDIADWEAVARAHGARFAGIDPANTLVGARLVGTDYRVEIEAQAQVGAGP